MHINLHVTADHYIFQTRINKQVNSLVDTQFIDKAYILARHKKGLLEYENNNMVDVYRIKLRSRNLPKIFLFQAIKLLEFYYHTIKFAQEKKISIINAHSLSVLPVCVVVKLLFKAKLVYDAHELETEIYGLSGIKKGVAKIVEKVSIKYVDLAIVVSDSIEKWYREQYKLSKVVTIYNCPYYVNPGKTKILHKKLSISYEKKILLYQGALKGGRGIEGLLNEFAENRLKNTDYVMVFLGYGELDVLIKEYGKTYGNIFLHEAVEPSIVLKYTASADIGISFIDNDSLNDRYCLPNKLFEFIMAGLPVIVNDAPEMKKLVDETDIGVVIDTLCAEDILDAIRTIEKKDQILLQNNLRETAYEYSWDRQSQKMINAYKEILL